MTERDAIERGSTIERTALARALALALLLTACRATPDGGGAREPRPAGSTQPVREPAAPPPEPEARASAPAADSPAPAPSPWPADEGFTMQSNAGTYWVAALAPGGELPLNEEFDLVVRVLDAATRSRIPEDAELRVDARMPDHGHGMKHDPLVERQEDGSWIARGMLLHMGGRWEIYFDLTSGPITERAQLAVELE